MHSIVFAAYVWCANHHGGQWSREYRVLSRIDRQYSPRICDSGWKAIGEGIDPHGEWLMERDIYLRLCASQDVGCDCLDAAPDVDHDDDTVEPTSPYGTTGTKGGV